MLDNFKIAIYSVELSALEPLHLPVYKGSTLRGGFGSVFRRMCCAERRKDCRECILQGNCPYFYIFETAPGPDAEVLRGYESVPRPFILEPPLTEKTVFEPGESLFFNLILIGRAIGYLPYFIVAFRELGKVGIGRGRGKFRLAGITARHPLKGKEEVVFQGDGLVRSVDLAVSFKELESLPLPGGRELQVEFLTMTRLKYDGRYIDTPHFHVIIRNLLGRISSLSYFHTGEKLELDFQGIIQEAERVSLVSSTVSWVDWERYSSRQRRRMKLGGMVGTACYEALSSGGFASFWPWLKVGELIHLGKNTAFGLGKMTIAGISK